MKQFEYITVPGKVLERNAIKYNNYSSYKPKSICDYYELNHFGEDGWELVSVTKTYETGTTFYFKREKQYE